ncbi:MAG: TIGR03862 family flavoprotein [Methylobacteriaceae bacterium]|jgi:uncharacterized flavoprotein (TIGR03862 family)|nr:TIGR03862 family flavoprotein [Methylobacteriaceae bacterium]
MHISVAVVGAGPAGLMSAERLAANGIAVAIFERTKTPARKFLRAGIGGLNLTHSEDMESFLTRYDVSSPLLLDAVRGFTPQDLRDWCGSLGVPTFIGSSGRVFPECMKASPLLRALRARLENNGVEFVTHHRWQGWSDSGALLFETPDGQRAVRPRATLLALGGASWPGLGSDGGWVAALEQRGVAVTPLKPANMGVHVAWSEVFRARFEGTPVKSAVFHYDGAARKGEAVVTRYGLLGPPVYGFASRIRRALERGEHPVLTIDGKPDMDADTLAVRLAGGRRGDSLSERLRRTAHLSPVIAGLMREATGNRLPTDAPGLAALIKRIPLAVTGTEGLEKAISTAGGIAMDELNDGFMLKKLPGVFAAGEMLDWDAPPGGYLLQACFSTAVAAAEGVREWLARGGTAG